MLLMHSSSEFVPVTHSNSLADALRAAGVRVTVRTLAGTMHGGEMLGYERWFRTVVSWMDSVAKR